MMSTNRLRAFPDASLRWFIRALAARQGRFWARRFVRGGFLRPALLMKKWPARHQPVQRPAAGQQVRQQSEPPRQPSRQRLKKCLQPPRVPLHLHRDQQQISNSVRIRFGASLLGRNSSLSACRRFHASTASAACRNCGSRSGSRRADGVNPDCSTIRATPVPWCRWWDSNPHGFLRPRDFKSRASAISPHRQHC